MSTNRLLGIIVVFLTVTSGSFGAGPAAAQPEDPPEGTECADPPEFSFGWIDTDVSELKVKADPAQRYAITLEYLDENPGEKVEAIALAGRAGADEVCWSAGASKDEQERVQKLIETIADACKCPAEKAKEQGQAASTGKAQAETTAASKPLMFCVHATPDGTRVPLRLDREEVLRGGGFVRVAYNSTETYPKSCEETQVGAQSVRAMKKHYLSFDVGPVFNLEGSGSWANNMEAALTARSDWFTWFQGGVSGRYSAIDTGEDSTDDPPAGEPEENDGEFNPFEEGGGVFEASVYGVLRPPKTFSWAGIVAGAGLSSIPGAADSELETRQRTFAGIRFAAQGYNAGDPKDSLAESVGFIHAGLAWDDLWEEVEIEPAAADGSSPAVLSDESKRYFLEGELELPRVGTEWARIVMRLYASVPRSGDGPSDVRVSALMSIDPRKWFPGLKNDGSDEE